MSKPVITGWDMTAVLALGQAMDLPPGLMADFLPDIESVMVRELRKGRENG